MAEDYQPLIESASDSDENASVKQPSVRKRKTTPSVPSPPAQREDRPDELDRITLSL